MRIGSPEDWLRLHLTQGLGRKSIYRLIDTFGSPAEALNAPVRAWTARCRIRDEVASNRISTDNPLLHNALEQLQALGASMVSYWDQEGYPSSLRTIHDPPALLYVRGRLTDNESIAIVGSRRASRPGREFTTRISEELASTGICIVSGLARGIDSAAHRGALSASGQTIAVLGCGIDQVYPPENHLLFEQIMEQGAIVSEYPPGTQPLPGHFPGRNRIISGLSRGVLVVEAASGSGSLHTAEFALESGREVFAVPNGVQMATANGVNQLIKDGARVVTESRDILETLWPERITAAGPLPAPKEQPNLPDSQLNILNLLSFNPTHRDTIIRKSNLTPMEVSDILLHLELAGFASQLPGGHYVRNR